MKYKNQFHMTNSHSLVKYAFIVEFIYHNRITYLIENGIMKSAKYTTLRSILFMLVLVAI